MLMIGCDFHTLFQQIAILNPSTGEIIERPLDHEVGEARKFSRLFRVPPGWGWKLRGVRSGSNECGLSRLWPSIGRRPYLHHSPRSTWWPSSLRIVVFISRLRAAASAERSPCFSAFILARSLPSGVLGPVLFVHGRVSRMAACSDLNPLRVSRYDLRGDCCSLPGDLS